MIKETVKLSVDDFIDFVDDEDYKNAIGTVDFLSTRPNSHKHIYSEEVLKKYASSVINSWIIADYSEWDGDVTTHTDGQNIVGRVPEQDVKFRYDEDGYLVASVDVVISKLYATEVYNLFKTHNDRAVSCELIVNYDENEDGSKNVISYDICGITLLGLKFLPSVPKSKIEITKFSKEDANKTYQNYMKKNDSFKTNVLSKLDEISDKLNKKEGEDKNMAKKKVEKFAIEIGDTLWSKVYSSLGIKYPDVDGYGSIYRIVGIYEENGEKFIIVEGKSEEGIYKIGLIYTEDTFELSDELIKVEQTFVETEVTKFSVEEVNAFEVKYAKEKSGENKEADVVMEEAKAKEPEKMNEDCKDDCECLECKKLTKEKEELTEKLSAMESEMSELKSFKAEILAEKTNARITETLSEMKEKLDGELYSEMEELSKSCTYENIDNWVDKVFATYGRQRAKTEKVEEKQDEIFRFSSDNSKTEKVDDVVGKYL